MLPPPGRRSPSTTSSPTPPASPASPASPTTATTEWKDTNPTELVARFRDKPLDFEPGTKFNYSNSGYVLLGYLIEKISGQTYADFLQQNIFTPLGMTDTGIDSNAAILPQRAQGYRPPHRASITPDTSA